MWTRPAVFPAKINRNQLSDGILLQQFLNPGKIMIPPVIKCHDHIFPGPSFSINDVLTFFRICR